MINSRSLDDLDPEVKEACLKHIELCKTEGIELLITSTYRDYEEQDKLYSQGRVIPGPIVTHARAGESYHNFRAAYDAIPLIQGKADWNAGDPPFLRMIALGVAAGLECGFYWKEPKQDPDHFQYRPLGQTAIEAKAAFDQNGSIFA